MTKSRILILTKDHIGSRMAGPGIRMYTSLARHGTANEGCQLDRSAHVDSEAPVVKQRAKMLQKSTQGRTDGA